MGLEVLGIQVGPCCHRSDMVPVPSQLPYTELEKVSGIEEAKHYLRQKLRELRF